jgi:glycogen synthase
LRICFITPEYALNPPFGGIATYTRDAAQWFADQGHTVQVFVPSKDSTRQTLNDQRVQIHIVPYQRIRIRRILNYASKVIFLRSLREAYCGWSLLENSVNIWREVIKENKKEPFDIIEVADWSGLGFWGLFRKHLDVPVVVRSHGFVNENIPSWNQCGSRFQLALERYVVQNADMVLAASQERVKHYSELFHVPLNQITSLPYGLAVAYLQTTSRLEHLAPSTKTDIFYLGRIERRKGCDVLFHALEKVHQQIPSITARFVGYVAADMNSEFAEFLARNQDWVEHVEAVSHDQAMAYLAHSKMVVLPSRFETLPRVLLEALAVGTPQIATPVNGIPEVIEHNVTGYLVEPDNAIALAAAMADLYHLSDKEYTRMCQHSQQKAEADFDLSSVMPKQLSLYRKALKAYRDDTKQQI